MRVSAASTKRRTHHSPEQIVKKLRDGEAMLNAGKDLAAVLQSLEVSEASWNRWRNQYGGMKSEEASRHIVTKPSFADDCIQTYRFFVSNATQP